MTAWGRVATGAAALVALAWSVSTGEAKRPKIRCNSG